MSSRRIKGLNEEGWNLEIYSTHSFFANLYKSVGELRHGFADVRLCRGDVAVVERRPEGGCSTQVTGLSTPQNALA